MFAEILPEMLSVNVNRGELDSHLLQLDISVRFSAFAKMNGKGLLLHF